MSAERNLGVSKLNPQWPQWMDRKSIPGENGGDTKMDNPLPGFREGVFTPENWNDPTIGFIRKALGNEDIPNGIMRKGRKFEVKVDIGVPDSLAEESPAYFYGSQVITALGRGVIIACPWHEDQTMVLILPEQKKRVFYISWYKNRGETEKLCYLNMVNEGEFQEAEPMTYEDAIWIGHFVNSIQNREPLRMPSSAFTKIKENKTG